MACNRPLLRINDVNNGYSYVPFSYFPSSFYAFLINSPGEFFQELPCRHCYGCSRSRQLEWVSRFMLDFDKSTQAYMLTLTFDNIEYLKRSGDWAIDDSFQLFIKRFRRYFDYHYGFKDIKYIAVRELGSKGRRVHYHAVIWNVFIPDLKAEFRSLFSSKIVAKLWPFGFFSVIKANAGAVAYVLKYVVKYKQRHDKIQRGFYSHFVGKKWFLANLEQVKKNQLVTINGSSLPFPKYFTYLLKKYDFRSFVRKKTLASVSLVKFLSQQEQLEVNRFRSMIDSEIFLYKKSLHY